MIVVDASIVVLALCDDGQQANVTIYDAVYVALAELLGVPLLTADRKLANAPGIRCQITVLQP